MQKCAPSIEPTETKRKLLDASVMLMRTHGYNATTVDHICAEAGVTKGGFFHYFKSKDDIGRAAVACFFEGRKKDYEASPFRHLADPLDRVFGRLDYANDVYGGKAQVTRGCLIGMFAQELALTVPEIRDICQIYFSRIAQDFSCDLEAARSQHAPKVDFDPPALAKYYVALVQGSLVLAKSAGNNDIIRENLEQFRAHLKLLFGLAGNKHLPGVTNGSYN